MDAVGGSIIPRGVTDIPVTVRFHARATPIRAPLPDGYAEQMCRAFCRALRRRSTVKTSIAALFSDGLDHFI